MASSLNNSAWLEWMAGLMGGGSRQSHAASFPPNRFYCLLDELPLHLIPRWSCSAGRLHDRTQMLDLNPDCTLCSDGQLPAEVAAQKELVSRFALQGTIAWVRDAATGCLLPFWLGPELEEIVETLRSGKSASSALPVAAGDLLQQAGILIATDPTARARKDEGKKWEKGIRETAASFQQRGYAPLPGLIHPFHVAALRRYYRYLIRAGALELGDQQSQRRYVAYNEPVARFFHRQIVRWVTAVAGVPVKPSYVYLAAYLGGAELRKHTDRAQCEFSVTLCLDFSPEPELETPWPIRLDTAHGTITVYQALGDGLAYRGTQVPHYRDRLGEGQTSTSIFFHYVPDEFTGSLE
ncbi:MAG TPA: hypothetical protein VE866_11520 [Candidatus Binatia bacterium]|jgi:hypothetical protein|nr:hypothetical protein [Candidatus Binatia bacterium]